MKRLSILGSTGSVGTQTLAVVERNPDAFCVEALAAGGNIELLAEQVKRFAPKRVSVADEQGARELVGRVGEGVEVHVGAAGLEAVATHDPCDLVVAALVGAVGLAPTLAAIRAGRDIALANKEVMVMAGALVLREVKAHGVTLLPVDSEHSAIFQALCGHRLEDVSRIILTCSGGPFRGWDAERIQRASVEEALNHPNWDMGAKISIDSASLMNKGLEVIEARWMFDVAPECIDVVVHPQSIVHSLVEFRDTSVIAQLGLPDMRVPIAVALAHPERVTLDIPRLDLAQVARLDFEAPDRAKFPCLDLAYRALSGSEEAPAVLNAANEISVAAFLAGSIPFGAIAASNAAVLDAHLRTRAGVTVENLDTILAADGWAREAARTILEAHAPGSGMTVLDYLFAVIPMLGILIFVHELGHFLVAKWCGVRVLKFSLGFGSPIGFGNMRMRWVRGGTEYVVAWFPLGGFVKMLGEQMQGVQGEEPETVPDARPDEYLDAKPTWQKLAITFAGPVMNLLLPVVAFVGVLAAGLPQLSPVVGMVEAQSPADVAGLRAGDRMIEIDGVAVSSWDEVAQAVRSHEDDAIEVRAERGGETLAIEIPVEIRSAMDEFGGVVEVGWIGVGHRRFPTMVGVPRSDSPATTAGLLSGDRIARVGETEVDDWEALIAAYAALPTGSTAAFHLQRGTPPEVEETELQVPVLADLAELGLIPAAVLVRNVSEDMPAGQAGLEPGDLILAVDGAPIGSFATFAETVRTSGGRSLDITYARGGETLTVPIAPKESQVPGPFEITGMEQTVYLIGITHGFPTLPGASHIEKVLNPLVSIPKATQMTVERAVLFLRSLGKLVSGDVGLENVSGPIGIAEVARKSLDMGWLVYLNTMIFISINLGFLNLLPIPILDGGQALIIMVEGVKRSPISLRSREIVQQIGLTFILMLMGLAFWNDLSRHWGVFVEWLRGTGL